MTDPGQVRGCERSEGEEIECRVEKVVYGGFGLARVDDRIVFAPGVLAGERVRVRIQKIQQKLIWAKPVEWLETSSKRVTAPCAFVERCGGCQYQHAAYEAELEIKNSQVREALAGLKSEIEVPEARPIAPSPAEYGYRNSVSLHPSSGRPGVWRASYKADDGVTAIVVDGCLLAEEPLQPYFKKPIRFTRPDERACFRVDAHRQVQSGQSCRGMLMEVGGRKFLTAADGFFQVNTAVAGMMAQTVADWVREAGADWIVDCYAGVGLLGLFAAGADREVLLIEENRASFDCLDTNIRTHAVKGRALCARTEKALPEILARNADRPKTVILDPPRRGLQPPLAKILAEASGVRSLIYVSCDLACLVRDLKILTGSGRWKMGRIQPFDMFPRTRHIEVVTELIPQ